MWYLKNAIFFFKFSHAHISENVTKKWCTVWYFQIKFYNYAKIKKSKGVSARMAKKGIIDYQHQRTKKRDRADEKA